MNTFTLTDYNLITNFRMLRKSIGIVGTLMSIILYFGALIFCQTGIRGSLSAYYHTCMRDPFVGMLCVIGVFLFGYKGYENKDNFVSSLAGISAIGLAFFPTIPQFATSIFVKSIGVIHLVFALLFFATLIYFCLFLFTKTTADQKPTSMKLQRNRIYRWCGSIMATGLLLILIVNVLPSDLAQSINAYNPTFWLESIMIVAFGISWLTKGEAFLQDFVPDSR